MRITIIALGSRGDVQPFVALGLGLEADGHKVRVAAAADYKAIVNPYGLEFAPVGGSVQELMDRELVYSMLDRPGNMLRFARRTVRAIEPLITKLVAGCFRASLDADMLIVSTLGAYCGQGIAEKLGIPMYTAHMHPQVPNRTYPHAFFPTMSRKAPFRGLYNLLTHTLGEAGFWQFLLKPLNKARVEVLKLPPLSRIEALGKSWRTQKATTLLAYSPLIVPKPRDWGENIHVTGYWFLERAHDWRPEPELVDFLASGAPPIYVGFGSNLVGRDADDVTALIVRALARTGQRGIITSGWGDLGNIPLPDFVFKTGPVPHDWLFPKVAVAVHHGGAGTTAAALRAGIPSIVVPFFGDQRFWAQRVWSLGAGPKPIPRLQLTEERLAQAIRSATTNSQMRAKAQSIGKRLATEDGVGRAITALGLEKKTIEGRRQKAVRITVSNYAIRNTQYAIRSILTHHVSRFTHRPSSKVRGSNVSSKNRGSGVVLAG